MTRNATLRLLQTYTAGITLAFAGAVSAQGPVAPPPGIVGWWALDGSADDYGALGFHGSVAGAGGTFGPGQVLEGFSPTGPDGHISVPDDDILDEHANFTFECWVFVNDYTTGHSYIVNKGSANHRSTPYTFGLIRNDNTFPTTSGASMTGAPWQGRPFVTLSDNSLEQVVIGGASVPKNTPVHLAFTVQWMNPGYQCKIYMNGSQIGFSWLSRLPFANTSPLQIGGIAGGSDNSIDGWIDELTMYDQVLTAAQIQSIHAAGPDGKSGKANRDTDPPAISIDMPLPGQVLANPSVGLQTTILDDSSTTVDSIPAGLMAQLPDGGGTASGLVNLTGPDGGHTITVQAIDVAGNAAATSVDIVLDTTPPVITVISPLSGTVFGSSPAQLAVQVDDMTATDLDVAGNPVRIPAGGATVTVDVSLLEGSNSIDISAIDAAGNTTDTTWGLTLDQSAPVVSVLNPPDGSLFGAGQELIAVTARVDDLTATSVSSSPSGVGGSLPAGGGILSGSVSLQEGLNQVLVTASDSAGSSSSASITVNLDTTAPMATFSSPGSGELLGGTVQVAADAQDVAPGSGIAQVELFADQVLVDSASGASLLVDLDTTSLADGDHMLMVVVTDGAGNQGSASLPITVDNTPPSIGILAPTQGATVSGTGQFSAVVTDSGSGVTTVTQQVGGMAPTGDGSVQLSSPAASVQVDSSEDTTRWPNGDLTCEVQASDMAGNTVTVQVSVTVDNTVDEPVGKAPLLSPCDGSRVSGKIVIKAVQEGACALEIRVDGQTIAKGSQSPLTVQYDTRHRMDGPMEITALVRDAFGKTGAATHNVVVDNIHVYGLFPSHLGVWTSPVRGFVWIKLHSKGGDMPLGPDTRIELRPRGGNSVRAMTVYPEATGRIAWVVFDRSELIASIRGALATGRILDGAHRIRLDCYIDGSNVGPAHVKLYLERRRARWFR